MGLHMMKPAFWLALIVLAARQAAALPNPAAAYCNLLGYEYKTVAASAGVRGVAVIEPGIEFDAWDFFKGKVGSDFAFGALYGYDTECVRTNLGGCTLEYAVCVPRGQKQLQGAARIPLLEFMAQKGVPLFDETSARKKRAADGEQNRPALEEDALPLYDLMAQGKALPSSWDWRARNGHAYIGPVRDQGACGSCYAFGANAAAEGTYNFAMGLSDGSCADFSEAFIIWCLGRLAEYNPHFYGCGGSDWDYAELSALVAVGVCSEADFPYTVVDPGSCTHWSDPRTQFSAWHRVPCGDIEAIKTAIMTYGVIDASVYASSPGFDSYSSGIFSDALTNCPPDPDIGPECYHTYTDHAISLVGWDDNPPEGGGGCWILRNSWGASWGESGYMRLRYHAARVACEATYLVYLGSNTHTLAVASAHGQALPPAGVITNNHGASLACSITNSPLAAGTTQYVCAGWTGAGSVPATGSDTNTGVFTLTNDSSITWRWRTNVYLSLAASGSGRLDTASGWQALDSSITVTATPSGSAWLAGWRGDTNGCVADGNRIVIPMTAARSITALFGSGSLAAPAWLSVSQGSFSDKVWLMWGGVAGASGYTVWRSLLDNPNSAAPIGAGAAASYSDTSAVPVTVYFYWVKATNAWTTSAFSPSAWGWRASAAPQPVNGDYDGDAKADPAVFAGGRWFVKLSSDGYSLATVLFGASNAIPFAADYDGDRKADLGIFDPATGDWQVKLSGSGYAAASLAGFGDSGSEVVRLDFDGDGLADPAVYNTGNGNWRIMLSGSGYGIASIIGFGGAGFTQAAGFYDADAKADPAIYGDSTGNWGVKMSSRDYLLAALAGFGGEGQAPIPADFDGDGLADPAIYAAATGTWQVKLSGSGYGTAALAGFGGTGYAVSAADFDGDGKADPALLDLATGAWRIKLSGSGYTEAGLASGWVP